MTQKKNSYHYILDYLTLWKLVARQAKNSKPPHNTLEECPHLWLALLDVGGWESILFLGLRFHMKAHGWCTLFGLSTFYSHLPTLISRLRRDRTYVVQSVPFSLVGLPMEPRTLIDSEFAENLAAKPLPYRWEPVVFLCLLGGQMWLILRLRISKSIVCH
jgi:hypothetical protein